MAVFAGDYRDWKSSGSFSGVVGPIPWPYMNSDSVDHYLLGLMIVLVLGCLNCSGAFVCAIIVMVA